MIKKFSQIKLGEVRLRKVRIDKGKLWKVLEEEVLHSGCELAAQIQVNLKWLYQVNVDKVKLGLVR